MQTSSTVRRIGIVALFVAEIALIAVVAYGAADLPTGGIMVGEDDVDIQASDQQVYGAVSIDRILTPTDGWVILRADRGDGVPAELIGAAPVRAGENRNVGVVIDRSREYPEGAFVSLLADKGTVGAFEYTTGDPNDSVSLPTAGGGMGSGMGGSGGSAATEVIDKPLIAAGEVVSSYLRMTPVNIVYHVPEANMGAAFLANGGSAVDVQRVDAPVDSWVVVVRGTDGETPNEIIGSAFVPAGRGVDLRVELAETVDAPEVTVLLLADLGMPGVLEANPVSPSSGPDAAFLVFSYYVQIPVIGSP